MRRFSIVLTLGVLAATGCSQQGAATTPVIDGARAIARTPGEAQPAAASFTAVYDFKGRPDGAVPVARLTAVNGTLYGTTKDGGARHSGTVFSVLPNGRITSAAALAGAGQLGGAMR